MRIHWSRAILLSLTPLLALATASLRAEDYSISTFAGVGLRAGSTDGTQGGSPEPLFNNPYGVTIDGAKNLYVADTVNNTIRKISPSRTVSTLAGTAGSLGTTDGTGAAARFNFPTSVAADAAGNVYVADFGSNTIRKVTPGGVVSTIAGTALVPGSTNGVGASARFFHPSGVAVDSSGNLYVADSDNHLIRKISIADGTVSTLAGGAQTPGSADGSGTAARFNTPWGVAVDGAGNVYVTDSNNHTIRKVTAGGVVSTIGGSAGVRGSLDGPGSTARFDQPRGIAVDGAGNVYITDYNNATIRVINAAGIVTTVAGSPRVSSTTDGVGAAARFQDPSGIVADGNVIYVADSSNNLIRRGQPASAATLPTITIQPLGQEIAVGQSVTLRVAASGATGYQWLRNGAEIAGATSATYAITNATVDANYASYSVRISGPGGAVESQAANIMVVPPGSGAIQITSRPLSQQVDTGQSATFSVTATGANLRYQWLKNGTTISGATNASYTIASAQGGDAGNYSVRLTSGDTTDTATARLVVGVDAGPPFSISQQPVSRTVAPGESASFFVGISGSTAVTYQWYKNDTAIANSNNATYTIPSAQTGDQATYKVKITGSGLELTSDPAVLTVGAPPPPPPPPPPATFSRLSNLSILTSIDSAGDSFTMGYVVRGGTDAKPILIRAAGPTLGAAPFSIPGVLADPKMELFVGSTKTNENDNWGGTAALSAAFTAVGAFPYATPTSLDAAVLANISPGDNSVKVSATGNGTGTVIAELYDSTPIGNMTTTSPRLVNVSILKPLGSGLTAGFVIDGNEKKKVLIRAVGPTIGTLFGVPGAAADPQLTLFSGQTAIGSNDNWGGGAELSAAFTAVGAFALPPASLDAALIATLDPGSYTVQVSARGATGTALVEVYEMQ